ncbi:MAG: hypothetical protein J5662_05900, partial [Clostridia bacterium]|nr:hypothetical protein [Clostridia bacterium]
VEFKNRVFERKSSDADYLNNYIREKFDKELKRIKFNKDYANLPTAREVQYNKYGYATKCFIISGVAELDDYYNWSWENCEYTYFCINIRPMGGNYSDKWYIYANRDNFSDLFEILLKSSKRVTLVAYLSVTDLDTGSNNMARLVDYMLE